MVKNANRLIPYYENEGAAFFKRMENSRRIDNSFALPDDEPLTEEEIAAIDAFWGKYKFAYPNIDYKSFQTFKNRCGYFDVHHCPGAIRTSHFAKYFVGKNYNVVFQNKCMFDFLFPDIQKPRSVVRRMNGIYYDTDYNPLTLDEAVQRCCDHVKNVGNLIVKPNNSSGGAGIIVLNGKNTTPAFVRRHFVATLGISAIVVQEFLQQSPFMNKLNATSVNTMRVTTLLHQGKVHHLAALIRIGNVGSQVDNWCSGGSLLGIDVKTGKCNQWAMRNDCHRITKLNNGFDVSKEELIVPNFERTKELLAKSHYRIPYIKMISWDVALDQNDQPTFIECNFAGMLQIHEAVTGPLFGDLMEELCDTYLLKEFYLHFATESFVCREYHDHVEIEEYIAAEEVVRVPEVLRGKPVTRILPAAFKGCKIKSFLASPTVIKNSAAALKNIAVDTVKDLLSLGE